MLSFAPGLGALSTHTTVLIGCNLPGVELALFGSLLLEDASVFKLDWTGDETDVAAFLHQTAYPPVVVVFLRRINEKDFFFFSNSPRLLLLFLFSPL